MSERQTAKPPTHATRLVVNRSSRRGAPIQAIAVHSTESSDIKASWDDLKSVGNWFNTSAAQASSHIGIDGDGHSSRWVPDDEKAWTILQLNDRTLNIEFVGRAAQPRDDWEAAQIKTGARWAAYWAIKFGLPIQLGAVKNINGAPVISRKGIIRHSDLTAAGFGSHTDPGPNFPMREFLENAQWYRRNGWYLN